MWVKTDEHSPDDQRSEASILTLIESSSAGGEFRAGEGEKDRRMRAIFPSLEISHIPTANFSSWVWAERPEGRSLKISDSQTWLNMNNTENLIVKKKYQISQH